MDDQGNSATGIPEEELAETLDADARQIPEAVAGIYQLREENEYNAGP
ncbi:hypothetical protein [Roseovarius indicus]|nr:hypothetical protein [Roseovarius indicus]